MSPCAAEVLFSMVISCGVLSAYDGGNLSSFGGGILSHSGHWLLSCCSRGLGGSSLVALGNGVPQSLWFVGNSSPDAA